MLVLTGCGGTFSPASGWSGIVQDAGALYVGSLEGRLLALSDQGQPLWTFPPEGERRLQAIYGTPAVADGRVYVGEYDDLHRRGAVYALDATDRGARLWATELGGAVASGVTVAEGVVVVGSSDQHLYALDAASGRELWRFRTGGKVWSTPVVANGLVYAGSFDHQVYAVHLKGDRAGTLAWEVPLGGAVAAAPLVAGETVYVGSFDRTLYALDALTGRERWRFQGDRWFWGGAVSDGQTVYVGSLGGTLYALDGRTGQERWRFQADSSLVATPVLLEAGVVVATDSGQVFLVDRSSGQRTSSLAVGNHIRAPLQGEGQRVHLQAMDRTVRALSVEPWSQLWCFNTKKPEAVCS